MPPRSKPDKKRSAETHGPQEIPDTEIRQTGSDGLLIAAIGASAGGLEAGIDLLRSMDPDSGMAYVFIQHLDPTHSSIIKDLLAKETSMPVTEVTDGTKVVPNHVYVIPPNALMSIEDHDLLLEPRGTSRGGHMPIDHFMRALAEELGNRAIGVILSGTGSDGVLGMAEIQARGGVTFAQDPDSAKYDGMPRSAIAAGYVDYILNPKGIAAELSRLAHHPYVAPSRTMDLPALVQPDGAGINTVFQLLRRATRVDFAYYRKTTILRRIQRRMVVHKIDRFNDYVKYLQANPSEIKALYQDMLIHVTSFFRNPKVFENLKRSVFPEILKKKSPDSNIRIWVPGCASGEEAYSLAIALLEYVGPKQAEVPIQLFGTDISENSIKAARAGVYPANIQGDVSAERLRQFFAKTEGGYRINKNIREMCIFAQHNLLNDPPFSRMDLICCRNLLIYFEPVLQARVVSLFHYALRSGGYLVLGTSEGIGAANNLFNIEDRENKIFSKKSASPRQVVAFSMTRQTEHATDESNWATSPIRAETSWTNLESQRDFDRRLLAQYVPPTVFINEDLEVVHTRGKFNRYFKIPAGRPTLNIVKMAHEDLVLELQSSIARAKREKRSVHRRGIPIRLTNGKKSSEARHLVSLEVVPVKSGMNELFFMVILREEASPSVQRESGGRKAKSAPANSTWNQQIKRLEHELAVTKEHLQSLVEDQEATNEELQSANEEILSSNEELQSTNEELETAKEELQSTNEELSTVNDELRNRNLQITEGQKDLRSLLAGLHIAIVGGDSKVRDFTPQVRQVLDLLPEDVAGPILEVKPTGNIPDFDELIRQALANSGASDKEVTDRSGRQYRFRVLPYNGADQKSDGAVVTLIDTALAKRLSSKAQTQQDDGG